MEYPFRPGDATNYKESGKLGRRPMEKAKHTPTEVPYEAVWAFGVLLEFESNHLKYIQKETQRHTLNKCICSPFYDVFMVEFRNLLRY